MSSSPQTSLYVHVPFCSHKCEYCAFYSHAPGNLMQRYVNALVKELEMLPPFKPHTVFFGGGTPTLLTLAQWEQIYAAMDRLGFAKPAEWTVESNPATVSVDKARLFRSIGVTRVSMGVQSLNEQLLDRLGRIHSREQVFKSYDILRAAGFPGGLNVDLMFAIPGQTMEIWRETLSEAMALESEHLSCYEVIYEQDTPLFAQLQAGEFDVNEELACEMYDQLVETSSRQGFHQYEIANLAKHVGAPSDIPSFACRHNINYWRGGYYYAVGPSAAGYEPLPNGLGARTRNWSSTQMYCEVIEKGQRPIESREELPPLSRAGEIAAFGLRMNAGWPFESFRQATGFDLRVEWDADMRKLAHDGLGVIESERFRLNRRGLRLADLAAQEFLR